LISDRQQRDLEEQVSKLEARPRPLSGKPARGRLPGLFRGLLALDAEARNDPRLEGLAQRAVNGLAECVADRALLPAILEAAAQALWLAEALGECLGRRLAETDELNAFERLLLLDQSPELDAASLVRALGRLSSEQDQPSPEQARGRVDERARTPVPKRDELGSEVTGRALAALCRPDAPPEDLERIENTILWETMRVGKARPVVALAALDRLGELSLIPRLQMVQRLSKRIDRRLCSQRLDELKAEAVEALALSDRQLRDLLAEPFEAPEWMLLDAQGVIGGEAPEDEDARWLSKLQGRLDSERERWATRLEEALIRGEIWNEAIWREVFVLRADLVRGELVRRVLWRADAGGQSFVLRWDGEGYRDVFNEPVSAAGFDELSVAHPLTLDKDELELWREQALEKRWVQPFPQLFRLYFAKDQGETFLGRKLECEAPDLGRARRWLGFPLRGNGPWEISRRYGEAEIFVELDEEQRILSLDWDGEPSPIAISELALDLFDLLGRAFYGDDDDWRAWNKKIFRDPEGCWILALERYQAAPKRIPFLRRQLVQQILGSAKGGDQLTFEGRFVVLPGEAGELIELGSGRVHERRFRRHVPVHAHMQRQVWLPHERRVDPQLDRVLGTIAYFLEGASADSDDETTE